MSDRIRSRRESGAMSDDDTSDRGALLDIRDLNVQTKKQFQCVQDSAVVVVDLKGKHGLEPGKSYKAGRGGDGEGDTDDEEARSQTEIGAGPRPRHHWCCQGRQETTTSCLVAVVASLALLLSGCLLVYTVQRDQQTSAALRDLREKHEELSALCGSGLRSRPNSGEGGVLVADDDDREVADSDSAARGEGLPGRQGAEHPPGVAASALSWRRADTVGSSKQVR